MEKHEIFNHRLKNLIEFDSIINPEKNGFYNVVVLVDNEISSELMAKLTEIGNLVSHEKGSFGDRNFKQKYIFKIPSK